MPKFSVHFAECISEEGTAIGSVHQSVFTLFTYEPSEALNLICVHMYATVCVKNVVHLGLKVEVRIQNVVCATSSEVIVTMFCYDNNAVRWIWRMCLST